jgi:hypothetical protein
MGDAEGERLSKEETDSRAEGLAAEKDGLWK